MPIEIKNPGKSNWIYDDEFDMHFPCCNARVVRVLAHGTEVNQVCGAGPLTGDDVAEGRCSEHRRHI